MGQDFKAPHFWTEERLAKLAEKHRFGSPATLQPNFNLADFIKVSLTNILGKQVRVDLKDLSGTDDYPAYVPAGSLRLVCDDEVWQHGELGESGNRYVLAHESGHLVLHHGHELHFSDPGNRFRKWYMEEESTEWQAHTYARHLLLPDFIVSQYRSVSEIIQYCDVPLWLAERRYEEVNRRKYSGDACTTCGKFTLVQNGTCLKCGMSENTMGRS
jgi:hypothetical protein